MILHVFIFLYVLYRHYIIYLLGFHFINSVADLQLSKIWLFKFMGIYCLLFVYLLYAGGFIFGSFTSSGDTRYLFLATREYRTLYTCSVYVYQRYLEWRSGSMVTAIDICEDSVTGCIHSGVFQFYAVNALWCLFEVFFQ